ncbi:hypothetical protein CAPTEDRAFT_182965 [Capitella teleta]|uniref:tRNA (adenine(58)-N(1))-methyltransferase catalytic subunit TRMT61A n=1 Tax=Capitella teleta TaxID=283909 RepID=R7UWC0_CAPTE|nr:hypothetical protein CAPTEDRAFT_182965 [Capitella teleta]|eukprot:ELU10614.1 hypothetical protein CAPTEDRAFT_182965 [Capitella teleta]
MSFEKYKPTVEYGDTLVLFLGYGNMLQMTVEEGKTHQTKYGAIKHSDLIGKKYGCRIVCSKGWLQILHPTPELWTITLPHRTQILYSTDISLITFELDLKPGSVVIEAGTGSASLSHAILRTIAPTGHLHTFDFHEQRAETAREEFAHHGFGDMVTAKHRDVCRDGFNHEGIADAIFLDLPLPWEAAPFAKEALKSSGGRIASFSPCIEQVQKMCLALEQLGFSDIKSVECLLRTFDPKTIELPLVDLVRNKKPQWKKKKMEKNSAETEEDTSTTSRSSYVCKSGICMKEMPGHTGYLTFATLYPS